MADRRQHRGPHPADLELFHLSRHAVLHRACHDLSQLLEAGYPLDASLELIGNRFSLRDRQRIALRRAACMPSQGRSRLARRKSLTALSGAELAVDGFNLITTLEAALGGGVLLLCRDEVLRDMASMHGNYRKVAETEGALNLIVELLKSTMPKKVDWFFDRPVSNSGRLASVVRELMSASQISGEVLLVDDPDPLLSSSDSVIVSADSAILDACRSWSNLAAEAVERTLPEAWVVDLREGSRDLIKPALASCPTSV